MPNDGSFANYIVIAFDRPFSGYGVFAGPPGRGGRGAGQEAPPAEGIKEGETNLTGPHVGAYVKFATGQNKIVGCKVASSFISPEQAAVNLQNEIGSADFDTVRQHAEARWNQMLGRVKVEGGSEEQQRTFYSAFTAACCSRRSFMRSTPRASRSITARTTASCMTARFTPTAVSGTLSARRIRSTT